MAAMPSPLAASREATHTKVSRKRSLDNYQRLANLSPHLTYGDFLAPQLPSPTLRRHQQAAATRTCRALTMKLE